MPKKNVLISEIDKIIEKYEELQKKYDIPLRGAIFDCLKAAQKPDGSIPQETEKYLEEKLNFPLIEQRRVRSFYDMLAKDIKGGASGKASETLFKEFLSDKKAWEIKTTGPLLKNAGPKSHQIKEYIKDGGYSALKKAIKMSKGEIIKEVEKSGLLGRGGAYFPAWIKWKDAATREAQHKFLVCNADEGEPPTCKDKILMDYKPHLLIEGMTIAGLAIGAPVGIIYIRGDYYDTMERLEKALKEAREMNLLGENINGSKFSFDIYIFAGSGSYVAGCSGGLVESIEGKAALPRSKQARLTQDGINHMPTVLSNVETLCNAPLIISSGGEVFAKTGSPVCPGTKIFNLCGDIANPGIYELPTGITLRKIIEDYGGGVIKRENGKIRKGELKAVSPGGATTALLSRDEIDVQMDHMSMREKRTSLGSGAITVFNSERNMREYSGKVLEFLAEETCGKCMQCPIIIEKALNLLKNKDFDTEEILNSAKIDPKPLNCELGKGSLNVITSAIRKFPGDFK